MTAPGTFLLPDPDLAIVPVVHGRLEAALAVREAIRAFRPQHVVVELPPTLQEAVTQAVERLPRLSVVRTVSAGDGAPVYLLVEPCEPLVEAVRCARDLGLPVIFADKDVDGYPSRPQALPDPYAGFRLGWGRYCQEVLAALQPLTEPEDVSRETTMVYHCQGLEGRALLVCGISHVPGILRYMQEEQALPMGRVRRDDVRVLHLHPDSAREVLSEMAWIQGAWERARGGEEQPDRLALHLELCRAAARRQEEEEKTRPTDLQVRALLQYARNLTLLGGHLAPDLYDLLLAARGSVDDNFAWWFWQEATSWPGQEGATDLPTVRVRLQDLRRQTRSFQFHRRESALDLVRRIWKPVPREVAPEDWKSVGDGSYHCSHPPEDVIIEGYASFLRKRTVGILAAEHARVEPFSTSMLDGVDLRETVRNLAHDGRLFVRENRPVKGRVGAVVLIFDTDPDGTRYPFRMTWQGEHDEESDMAFYATPPQVHMVGPGISRCEYGGLLMAWPPGRMFGVWEEPYFKALPAWHEQLLCAGILYSDERIVTYIADKPPRPLLRSLAERYGRKVVFIPLGQLSPVTLRRVRRFHILHGKHVRSYAADYIR